jgi:hypothetical protein
MFLIIRIKRVSLYPFFLSVERRASGHGRLLPVMMRNDFITFPI